MFSLLKIQPELQKEYYKNKAIRKLQKNKEEKKRVKEKKLSSEYNIYDDISKIIN